MLRLRKNHLSFNPRRQRSPVHCYPSVPYTHTPADDHSSFLNPPYPSSPSSPPFPSPRILEFTSLVAACTSTTHQEAPGSKRVPIFSHPLCPSVSLSSHAFFFLSRSKIHTRIEHSIMDRIESGRICFIRFFFSPKKKERRATQD